MTSDQSVSRDTTSVIPRGRPVVLLIGWADRLKSQKEPIAHRVRHVIDGIVQVVFESGGGSTGLDGGGTVFQRRLRDVMIGATAILVPAVALNVWVTILGFDRLDPNDSALPSFLGDDTGSGIEDVANRVICSSWTNSRLA